MRLIEQFITECNFRLSGMVLAKRPYIDAIVFRQQASLFHKSQWLTRGNGRAEVRRLVEK